MRNKAGDGAAAQKKTGARFSVIFNRGLQHLPLCPAFSCNKSTVFLQQIDDFLTINRRHEPGEGKNKDQGTSAQLTSFIDPSLSWEDLAWCVVLVFLLSFCDLSRSLSLLFVPLTVCSLSAHFCPHRSTAFGHCSHVTSCNLMYPSCMLSVCPLTFALGCLQ